MNLNPWLHRNTTAPIPIEGIGATEDADWRAGPVKGAAIGFKKLSYRIAPKP